MNTAYALMPFLIVFYKIKALAAALKNIRNANVVLDLDALFCPLFRRWR